MESKGQQSGPNGSQSDQDQVDISAAAASCSAEDGQDIETAADTEATTDTLSSQELQAQLAAQRDQTAMYIDHLQRLQAEFDNYRRRTSQEQLQATSRGKERVLLALLPIIANFHLALQHVDQDPNAVRQGVQMIGQQLESFLAEQGVERIETVGQLFDPSKHEALSTAPATEETPANYIVNEIKAGYLVEGRMLCPAQVIVAQAVEATGPAEVEQPSDSPQVDA